MRIRWQPLPGAPCICITPKAVAVAMRRGEPEEAVRHLEKARSLDPRHKQALILLARGYQRVGRTDAAERVAAAAKRVNGKGVVADPVKTSVGDEGVSYRAIEARATQAEQRGAFDVALEHVERALTLRPDTEHLVMRRIDLLLTLGRGADAEKAADAWLAGHRTPEAIPPCSEHRVLAWPASITLSSVGTLFMKKVIPAATEANQWNSTGFAPPL